MRDLLCLTIFGIAILSACQPSVEPRASPPRAGNQVPSPSGVAVSDKREYQCGDVVVSADFHGTGPVELRFAGKALKLPQVASGSGARYADDNGNEFWSKGDDAMFTIAGQPMRNCVPRTTPPG